MGTLRAKSSWRQNHSQYQHVVGKRNSVPFFAITSVHCLPPFFTLDDAIGRFRLAVFLADQRGIANAEARHADINWT
jgi:hypothetical protein